MNKNVTPAAGFIPKKYLGQHFLADRHVLRKIIDSCCLTPADAVLEIGAGDGRLTREIAPRVKKVIAVETDKHLCQKLEKEFLNANVSIVHEDFLKYDLGQLSEPTKVIGNLPYYISSPIIGRILEYRRHIPAAFLTVQLEFGNRMIAAVGTKDYSALSCFVQYYTEAKILFKIKNTSFNPRPKVDSCFIQLTIPKKPIYPANDEILLFKIIHQAFQKRRKIILNALSSFDLKSHLEETFKSLSIDPHKRAENLTINDFVDLSHAILSKI